MRPRGPHPPATQQPHRSGWKRKAAGRPPFRGATRASGDGAVILYGWHTVKAALENPARRIRRLYATANAARRLAEDSVALVLDQITDPHNVGAILRTAAGFAVDAVITTARHSPEATGVLAKSASGALEYVPIVTVQNLARALATLRERGYFLVGLDSSGDADLGDAALRAPLALVLGAEGKGLRQLTRATCDQVARLDLPGRIKSLNVSNAAALALYVATKRAS